MFLFFFGRSHRNGGCSYSRCCLAKQQQTAKNRIWRGREPREGGEDRVAEFIGSWLLLLLFGLFDSNFLSRLMVVVGWLLVHWISVVAFLFFLCFHSSRKIPRKCWLFREIAWARQPNRSFLQKHHTIQAWPLQLGASIVQLFLKLHFTGHRFERCVQLRIVQRKVLWQWFTTRRFCDTFLLIVGLWCLLSLFLMFGVSYCRLEVDVVSVVFSWDCKIKF